MLRAVHVGFQFALWRIAEWPQQQNNNNDSIHHLLHNDVEGKIKLTLPKREACTLFWHIIHVHIRVFSMSSTKIRLLIISLSQMISHVLPIQWNNFHVALINFRQSQRFWCLDCRGQFYIRGPRPVILSQVRIQEPINHINMYKHIVSRI